MFGYIRPLVGEMKVRENEMFRALYCGLCRAMGQHTGCASTLTLSYDFVFLAVFRAALTGEKITVENHRCAVHPLKKRAMAADCETLAYCARAAALLTYAKLQDDLTDERGVRRLIARTLRPAASSLRRRARKSSGMENLENAIAASLLRLGELEKARCDSIDEAAACFGSLLAEILAFGLSGTAERIAREAGDAVGRFIYVIDAADDAPDDARKGRYNPIVCRYGEDIFESRPVRRHAESPEEPRIKLRLKPEIAHDLYIAALCSLSRLEGAVALMDFDGCVPETEGILKNIAFLGIPAQLRCVLALDSPHQNDSPNGQR